MIFSYHPNSGDDILSIDGKLFVHLFRARRHQKNNHLTLSKLDDKQHLYQVSSIASKSAVLTKIRSQEITIKRPRFLHLAWCVIDYHTIKSFLPYLNQLGLAKTTFVMADRSQHNININLDKLNKFLIHSCEQCGRYDLMGLAISPNVDQFIKQNPKTFLLNFNGLPIQKQTNSIQTVMIGTQGGFTQRENDLFAQSQIISLTTPYVLKSENATLSVVSQLLNH